MVPGFNFGSKRKKTFHQVTDEELIRFYRNSGHGQYIGALFERYTHLVFGVCMKYLNNADDSQDAVMEIFEELHLKLLKHEVSSFKGWLYTVARNHCLMKLRKEKSEIHTIENYYHQITREIMESADDFHPSIMQEENDEIWQLNNGIETLKSDQRVCIELMYLQKKSYKEVCELTGFSMKQVKSHIQNGKRNLKIFLKNHEKQA
ncbi:MAG: RNA polymerase sigma factor [Bacteroidales bacterium]